MSEPVALTQQDIDTKNALFWDELCGSHAAKSLGVTGNDVASLAKFDKWFFDFYPYLNDFVPFGELAGKKVLEVGLGYGSVSQRLAENSADLTALDIAQGPVEGVNHRLSQNNLAGRATTGSILDAPFPDESFDYVVSIGCYHHTGDLPRALTETARILKPGGGATIMTYNGASYLRWMREPHRTFRYVRAVATGDPDPLPFEAPTERARYDSNSKEEAAPETVLLSKAHFRRLLLRSFREVKVQTANAVQVYPFQALTRGVLLMTIGCWAGLDLYAQVKK